MGPNFPIPHIVSASVVSQLLPVVIRLLLLAASATVSVAAARLTVLLASGFSSWMMHLKRWCFSLLL